MICLLNLNRAIGKISKLDKLLNLSSIIRIGEFSEDVSCTVVFQFKQVLFSMLKLKVFDLSKILCNEFKNEKSLQLSLCS